MRPGPIARRPHSEFSRCERPDIVDVRKRGGSSGGSGVKCTEREGSIGGRIHDEQREKESSAGGVGVEGRELYINEAKLQCESERLRRGEERVPVVSPFGFSWRESDDFCDP